jgi:hypothetical protein
VIRETTPIRAEGRVIRETTPIHAEGRPAFRDTLVLTYRARGFQAKDPPAAG